MPEGESQVGLVDVFNGNSNLRQRMCDCMRTAGHELSDLAGQASSHARAMAALNCPLLKSKPMCFPFN